MRASRTYRSPLATLLGGGLVSESYVSTSPLPRSPCKCMLPARTTSRLPPCSAWVDDVAHCCWTAGADGGGEEDVMGHVVVNATYANLPAAATRPSMRLLSLKGPQTPSMLGASPPKLLPPTAAAGVRNVASADRRGHWSQEPHFLPPLKMRSRQCVWVHCCSAIFGCHQTAAAATTATTTS